MVKVSPAIPKNWHIVEDIAKSSHPSHGTTVAFAVIHDGHLELWCKNTSQKSFREKPEIGIILILVAVMRCHTWEAGPTVNTCAFVPALLQIFWNVRPRG